MAADKAKKPKQKKEPFVARMRRRGRELTELGRILVTEPRQFPGALWRLIRRAVRTLWNARGGGLYACGYVLTFAWLEIRMFVGDIVSADSIGSYVSEQLFEIVFRWFGESLGNMILAFLWPLSLIELSPPWGLGALVVLYLVFPRWIKPVLSRWLFDEDEAAPAEETAA